MKKLLIIYISLLSNLPVYSEERIVALSSPYTGGSVVACSQINLQPGFSCKATPDNNNISFKVLPSACISTTIGIEGISPDRRFNFGVLDKDEHHFWGKDYMWSEYYAHYIKDNKLTFYARVILTSDYSIDRFIEAEYEYEKITWDIYDASNNKLIDSETQENQITGGPVLKPGVYDFTVSIYPFDLKKNLTWDILFQQSYKPSTPINPVPNPTPNPIPPLKGKSPNDRFDFGTHEEKKFNIGHYDYLWKGYKDHYIKDKHLSFYGKITLNEAYTITEHLDILAYYKTKTKICWDVYDVNNDLVFSTYNAEGILSGNNITLFPGTYYFDISMGPFPSADPWYWDSYFNWNFMFNQKATPITALANQNYILTTQPRVATSQITDNMSDISRTYRYFDGLGRPIQTVARDASPSHNDLVSVQEYDSYGRETFKWLPISYNTKGNCMSASIVEEGQKFYRADKAYSKPVYEKSPLNRPVQQHGPGDTWHYNNKAINIDYLMNSKSGELACMIFYVIADGSLVKRDIEANRLYVTKMTDEDGNVSCEFKNMLGQVVLTRQINKGIAYDTYFAYDMYDNLAFVIPPEGVDKITNFAETNDLMKQYVYIYKYDKFKRCIYKKLPGCEPIYYVYDKANRLIFTQDGEQRKVGKWTFSIPDAMERVALTGTCTNSLNYAANPLGNVVVKAAWAKATNVNKGYSITGVSISNPSVLSVNYYDNYEFLGLNSIPDTISSTATKYEKEISLYGTRHTVGYKGLLTGTLTGQMDANGTISPAYLYSVMYYDNRGRVIQTRSNNHLPGGLEKEYIGYNFTGQPTNRKHIHEATGKNTQTEVYSYYYDHVGRLKKTTHQLTDGTVVKPQVILAENTYDEVGRLKTSKKANNDNLNIAYTYNIRSWTKSISSPLFKQTLYYNESYGGSTKQYNGNISAMDWTVSGDKTRGYAFTYDQLSQLTAANYLENAAASANYKTAYTYDKHGNMKTLQRYGKTTTGTTYGLIDNLTISHTGNQLLKVTDTGVKVSMAESADFKDYSNVTTEYYYNANGAMYKDLNKGISNIQYNLLNLPRMVDIKSPVAEARNEYTYTAAGTKLKVVQKWNPNYSTTPVVGSDITVTSLTKTETKNYVGNIIYESRSDGTSKTRILVDGGYIEGGVYYFYIKDHLGNNRVVANASGTAIQKNHYYPFGMTFAETPLAEQKLQPYKYNDKEFDAMHGLNLYDYSARYMDATLPEFITVDPLAEKYYSISPYAYCANNPVNYTDPDGREVSFSYEWEEDEDGNYVTNKDGGRNLIGVTMNVTGKVINISSNSGVNMSDATKRISSQIESSFSGQANGVTFSTNVNLSVANSMDDVAESDHVFALADLNSPSGTTLQGVASSFGGKVAFIDADYFTGPLDTSIGNVGPGIAAHEFGHLAGLEHSSGLMMNQPGGVLWMTSTKMNNGQLISIHNMYKAGFLNQGSNFENVPYVSPSAGGTVIKKMPYRGAARSYVSY